MKFLLVGHSGCYNRGCEAIVQTTLMMIRKEFRKPSITVATFKNHASEQGRYGEDVKIVPAYIEGKDIRFSSTWVTKQALRLIGIDSRWRMIYQPIIKELKKADVVLSVGGDNYSVDYGLDCLKYFLDLKRLSKTYKRKLVIWGASIGPFYKNHDLKDIVDNLKMADLITIREKKSLEYLKELGIVKNVKLVADPAFLLMSDEASLHPIFYAIKEPILGVNISPILAKYSNRFTNDDIIKESVLFLRKVIENMKFHVLLIPHVTKSASSNNDYSFMETIYNDLSNTKMISRISPQYNAMQMKAIISKCRFFIGARTHSTIAALSSGVPTLSIGYSVKAKGINESLFGNDNYVINIKNLSAESLFDKFNNMYFKERDIKVLLAHKIQKVKELAYNNIRYLKEILD